MPIATLDACVLFRGMLTDLLLWIAFAGGFEPVWSSEIHSRQRPDAFLLSLLAEHQDAVLAGVPRFARSLRAFGYQI